MPQIQQRYLDCAIYLYDSKRSADAGENFGGSGCLVAVRSNLFLDSSLSDEQKEALIDYDWPQHLYAVTNNHVARRGYPVIRLNTIDGQTDVLELEHHQWIPHPDGDDLAIAPIELPDNKHRYFPIDVEQFVSRERSFSYIGAGDDTFMVGRFVNHAGKQRNTPSLRFGNIAMLPFEKVKLGDQANRFMQEAFLVETRSLSGFSGSPVFVYRPKTREGYVMSNPRFPVAQHSRYITSITGTIALLGIDCGHFRSYKKVVNGAGVPHPQGWAVETNTGMAIVIPAWRLKGLLYREDLVIKRQEKDRQWVEGRQAEEGAALDVEERETFTEDDYQHILKQVSHKVTETESKDSKKSDQ